MLVRGRNWYESGHLRKVGSTPAEPRATADRRGPRPPLFSSTEHNSDSAAVYAVFRGPGGERARNAPKFCKNDGLCGALHAAAVLRPDLEDITLQQF